MDSKINIDINDDTRFGNTQQDYKKMRFNDHLSIKDTFSSIFNTRNYAKNVFDIKDKTPPNLDDFNIVNTMTIAPVWFTMFFSLFSEIILFFSMIIYIIIKWKYPDRKWSLYLCIPILFNILLLPILLNFYFNQKHGLLRIKLNPKTSELKDLRKSHYSGTDSVLNSKKSKEIF